jgi:hypothetical protein
MKNFFPLILSSRLDWVKKKPQRALGFSRNGRNTAVHPDPSSDNKPTFSKMEFMVMKN